MVNPSYSCPVGGLWYPKARQYPKLLSTRGKYDHGFPRGAVVHYTAGGWDNPQGVLLWALQKGYTYLSIGGAGDVWQAHPLDAWGYHAKAAKWPGVRSVPRELVGIEICCPGRLKRDGNGLYWTEYGVEIDPDDVRYVAAGYNVLEPGYYAKYTPEQEQALTELLLWMHRAAPDIFSLDLVVGHDEVCPGRKTDPGGSLSMTMPHYRVHLKSLAAGSGP